MRTILLLGLLLFGPTVALANQPAPAIAAVFKDVCMDDTQNAFSSFDSSAARWGFQKDGIYWINDRKDTFQLHREQGILFCVFFYVHQGGEVKDWTRTVMSEVYPNSAPDFDTGFRDGRYVTDIGLLDRMPLEHKVMADQNGQFVYRIMIGVPE